MKLIRFDTAPAYEPQPAWKRVSCCNEKEISIEHFIKPPRHASPKHDHPASQVLVVLEGRIAVQTDEEGVVEAGPGDTIYIPGGQPHVVTNLLDEPSVGLDIFVPGRDFDFWLNRPTP